MVEARARWTDQERFLGIATSGHAIVIDAATEKTANSPMELVLIGLCACTASDVVSILRKKREPFTSLEVRAQAERPPNPPARFQPCWRRPPRSQSKLSIWTNSAARELRTASGSRLM